MACAYDLQDLVQVAELRLDLAVSLELEIHARQAEQELAVREADVRDRVPDFLDDLLRGHDAAVPQGLADDIQAVLLDPAPGLVHVLRLTVFREHVLTYQLRVSSVQVLD